jgi:hypothetical protein
MLQREPSRTALSAATYRAAHQVAEAGRLFYDPFALPIIRSAGEPFLTTFQPAPLHAELRSLGFETIEDFGPPELIARFARPDRIATKPTPQRGGHVILAETWS